MSVDAAGAGSAASPGVLTEPPGPPEFMAVPAPTERPDEPHVDPRIEALARSMEDMLSRAQRGSTRRADMLAVADTFRGLDRDSTNQLFAQLRADRALPALVENLGATGAGRDGRFALGLNERVALVGDLAGKLQVGHLMALAQGMKGDWYRLKELNQAVAERSPEAVEYERQAAAGGLTEAPTRIVVAEGLAEAGVSAAFTGVGLMLGGPFGAGAGASSANLLVQRMRDPNAVQDISIADSAVSGLAAAGTAHLVPAVAKGAQALVAGVPKLLATGGIAPPLLQVGSAARNLAHNSMKSIVEAAADSLVDVGAEGLARLVVKQEVRAPSVADLSFSVGVGVGLAGAGGPVKAAIRGIESLADPLLRKRIDEIVARSPMAQEQLETLRRDGWTFDWHSRPGDSGWRTQKADGTPADSAGYADFSEQKIGIHPSMKWRPGAAASVLLHEMGHAVKASPLREGMAGGYDYSSKQAYLRSRFEEEGVAELTRKLAELEITRHGGPSLPRLHDKTTAREIDKAAEQYLKDGDAEAARKRVGYLHSKGAAGDQTWYTQHYGAFFDRDYAWRNLPEDPTGRGPLAGPLRRASLDPRGRAVLEQRTAMAAEAAPGNTGLPRVIDGGTPLYIQVDARRYGVDKGRVSGYTLGGVDRPPDQEVRGVFARFVRPESVPGNLVFATRMGNLPDSVRFFNPSDRSRIEREGGLVALDLGDEVLDNLVRLKPGPRDAASAQVLSRYAERANEQARLARDSGEAARPLIDPGDDTKVYFVVSEVRLYDGGTVGGMPISAEVLQGRSGPVPDGLQGTLIEPTGELRPGERVVAIPLGKLPSDTWFVEPKPGSPFERLHPEHFWVGFGVETPGAEIIR